MYTLYGIALFLVSLFLILLVLVQRGRGGGLAGAFGGAGGQSAFGTKAGDMFTRITIGTALVWGLLCVIGLKFMNQSVKVEAIAEDGIGGVGATADPDGTSSPANPAATQDLPDTLGDTDTDTDTSASDPSADDSSSDPGGATATSGDDSSQPAPTPPEADDGSAPAQPVQPAGEAANPTPDPPGESTANSNDQE